MRRTMIAERVSIISNEEYRGRRSQGFSKLYASYNLIHLLSEIDERGSHIVPANERPKRMVQVPRSGSRGDATFDDEHPTPSLIRYSDYVKPRRIFGISLNWGGWSHWSNNREHVTLSMQQRIQSRKCQQIRLLGLAERWLTSLFHTYSKTSKPSQSTANHHNPSQSTTIHHNPLQTTTCIDCNVSGCSAYICCSCGHANTCANVSWRER
jgi:hypothetical protein